MKLCPEPRGGAHRDFDLAAANLATALRQNLAHLLDQPIEQVLKKRYEKFRRLGDFAEGRISGNSNRSHT